jgi:mono/diheme cytochrome c family protein
MVLSATFGLIVIGGAQARSARAGVYSEGQAKRGGVEYVKQCASCHGEDLSGAHQAPALVGPTFVLNWATRSVGDLVERMCTTMPQGDPGTLSRKTCLDITTFLLEANEYPAGEQELEDSEALQQLMMR